MTQSAFEQLQQGLNVPKIALDQFVNKDGEIHTGLMEYLVKHPVVQVLLDCENREEAWQHHSDAVYEDLCESGPDDDDWEPSDDQMVKALTDALPEFEDYWRVGDDEEQPYIIYSCAIRNADEYCQVLTYWSEQQAAAKAEAVANDDQRSRAVVEFFLERTEDTLAHLNNLPTENNPYCSLVFFTPTTRAAKLLAKDFFSAVPAIAEEMPPGLRQYMFTRVIVIQLKQPFNPKMATAEQLERAICEYNTNIITNGLPPTEHDMNEIVKWAADEAPTEMQEGAQFYKRMADVGLDVNLIMAGHNYRDQINEYQVDHQISSVLTDTRKIFGQEVTFQYCCDQLTIIPGDAEIVQQSVTPVCQFFLELIERHNLVLHLGDAEGDLEPCTIDRVIAESALGKSVFISCDSHVPLPDKPGWWGYSYESDNPDSVHLSIYYGPDHMHDDGVYFRAVNPMSEYYSGSQVGRGHIQSWSIY